MFPKFDLMKIYYQSDPAGGTSGDDTQSQSNQGDPETFETYLSKLPKEQQDIIKQLHEAHVAKLTNTVKATRQERDDFQKQLNAAIKKAEKGSELETQLTSLNTELEKANRKSDFYEQAPQYECKNPKAAFALALANDLFTKSGAPDWNAIKLEAPELFGKVLSTVKKTAGSGTGDEPAPANSMNDWIRKSAGVTPG